MKISLIKSYTLVSAMFLAGAVSAQEEDWRENSRKVRGIDTVQSSRGRTMEDPDEQRPKRGVNGILSFALQGGFPAGQFADTAAKYGTNAFGFNFGLLGRLNYDNQAAVFLGGVYEFMWWGTDNENLTTINGVTTGVELTTRSNAFNLVARLQPVKGKFRPFVEAGPGVRFFNTTQILTTNQIPGTAQGTSADNIIFVANGQPGNTTYETKTRISLSNSFNVMVGGGFAFLLGKRMQLDVRANYYMSTNPDFVHPASLRIGTDNLTLLYDRQRDVRLNQINGGVGITFLF